MDVKELKDELIKKVAIYNIEGLPLIKKAYELAYKQHLGQKRQSGEPYIIHPLSVAIILAELKVDTDTICAGLLHDVIEDTNITKEKIEEDFNKDIAIIVDGVSKIDKINFSTKKEETNANIRKLLMTAMVDLRIFLVKIADRLHNMRTLEFKSEYKQKENSIETMNLYVPIAYMLGVYRIMHELQDMSFYYIDKDLYRYYEGMYNEVLKKNTKILEEMCKDISSKLYEKDITNSIKIRTKNIYGIYNRMKKCSNIEKIHDLNVLKIMVEQVDDCYRTLRYVHELYHPIHGYFKDYICSPKTNMYQSLHTNICGLDNLLVQAQIRTYDMDEVASFGLATHWRKNGESSRDETQKKFREKYQFCETLVGLDKISKDDDEFIENAKRELFSNKIYVYKEDGNSIELPEGSTTIDFAYKISDKLGNTFKCAVVNDEEVDGNYILKDNDRVIIVTDNLYKPKKEWEEVVKTAKAKVLLHELTSETI